MAGDSSIEWTNKTWNIVEGCTHASAGCKNCYAEQMHNTRLVPMNVGKTYYQSPFSVVKERTDDKSLSEPTTWRRFKRVFVNSMADLLHKDVSTAFIMRAFGVMAERAPQHQYQILTKRAPRWAEINGEVMARWGSWPVNVLPGVSIESARHLDRLEALALAGDERTVRMVSAEPLLTSLAPDGVQALAARLKGARIGWLIAGGESGFGDPGPRPCELEWLRELRDACELAGVLFFLKQLGGRGITKAQKLGGEYAVLDGQRHTAMPPMHRVEAGLFSGPPPATPKAQG
jgi:protein gp37